MGWGTLPQQPHPVPSRTAVAVEVIEGVGHFVHIEKPDLVAGMVLDFLGSA